MIIVLHIYFNFSKVIYSCISRRELKFIGLELLGSLLTIVVALFINKHIYNLIVLNNFIPKGINFILYSIIYGFLFIGFSLLSRLILKKNPVEVAKIENNKTVIPIGIIDYSWISMLGIVYAGILFCNEFDILSNNLNNVDNIEYYKMYYNETNYLFNQTINIILILGTILAACMTIIWGGTIWKEKDAVTREQYRTTTMASKKMVFAFFIIVAAIIIWISIPLYLKMTNIKGLILSI